MAAFTPERRVAQNRAMIPPTGDRRRASWRYDDGDRVVGRDLNREKFVDTMEKMDVDLGGFHVAYSPKTHAGSKFVDLTIIARDGKFLR